MCCSNSTISQSIKFKLSPHQNIVRPIFSQTPYFSSAHRAYRVFAGPRWLVGRSANIEITSIASFYPIKSTNWSGSSADTNIEENKNGILGGGLCTLSNLGIACLYGYRSNLAAKAAHIENAVPRHDRDG